MNFKNCVNFISVLSTTFITSWMIYVSPLAETIRYADSDQTSCLRCQFLINTYFPSVTAATANKIEINALFGGVMGSNKENRKLVSDRVVDFSSTFVGYHNNVFPAQSAFDLFPRGPKNYENQLYFYHQAYERIPEIREELERSNLKLVMITPLLHLAFASKQPIESLADIQGQKWRAGTKWLLRYLQNVGAAPVSVPWSEVYVALQTGLINGVLTNYDGLNNAKFYEPAPHMLISPELWMANPMIYVVNKDFWNSLETEIQQAWLSASQKAEIEWGHQLYNARDEIIQSQRAKGVVVNKISAEDLEYWNNSEQLVEAHRIWIDEATQAGLKNAAGVLDELKKIHAEAISRDSIESK